MRTRTALVLTAVLVCLAVLAAGCSAVLDKAAELVTTLQPATTLDTVNITLQPRQATLSMPKIAMILTAAAPAGGDPVAANVAPAPTATREEYVLTRPAPTEEIAEPLLTLTAFNALLLNKPTATSVKLVMNGKPHLLDFWAGWCAPCVRMKPWIDDLQSKYGDRVTFDRIDIDFEYGLADQYKVVAIPLIVLIDKDGNPVTRLEGLHSEEESDQALSALVGEK